MSETKFDVAVIGAGPGGYVTAIRAAQLGLKTVCIEKHKALGGTCLNVGCIPSKALLQSSEHYEWILHESKVHGIEVQSAPVNFQQMMSRKQKVVESHVQGIDWLFDKNKITRILGSGRLTSPQTIEVDSGSAKQLIEAENIILATGSEPIPLPFLSFDENMVVSSTGVLSLPEIPKKMIVIGAGVIGVELASVYNRLGTEITIIEMLDKICPAMDNAISKMLQSVLKKQGLDFHLSAKVTKAQKSSEGISLTVIENGKENTYQANVILVAVGRRPYTTGLGLQEIGVKMSSRGFVEIDGNFRTNIPNVYAIGDIIDGPMLAHRASEEGAAVAEILAGLHPHVNYLAIPNVIYTHPEVAAVGLTEEEAKTMKFDIQTGSCLMRANSRARCNGYTEGMVKVIGESKSGRLIGLHIMCEHASEMIGEGVLALEKHTTFEELASYSHAHPTLCEAIKEAALNALGRAIHF